MYRALRRHYTRKHKERLKRIADFSGYPSGAMFVKKDENGKTSCGDREDLTYIKKTYRSKHGGSKLIKKQCHKYERNYDYALTPSGKGNWVHKVSDYWWTLT